MEDLLGWIFVLIWLLGPALVKALRNRRAAREELAMQQQAAAVQAPAAAARPVQARPAPASQPQALPVAAPPRPAADPGMEAAVERIRKNAQALAKDARVTRPTQRFVAPLLEYVVPGADALLRDMRGGSSPHPAVLRPRLQSLELVAAQIEAFIVQRKHPDLRMTLGDADAFAQSCYRPFADFARAHDVPLTSNEPVTEFGYDLSIWTAFIPTGIAPISLPPRFFGQIAWWPAVAHEIAHDVYNAVAGLDRSLRGQLGIVPREVGAAPLRVTYQGLSASELTRVFGGWFEEIFCDVFGTLMCGPAYAWTMVELFADADNPTITALVHVDPTGRGYDEHPPRHLRLHIACTILEHCGHSQDAEEIRDAWAEVHDGDPEVIHFPVAGQTIGVPVEPIEEIAEQLATALYTQPLQIFAGYRLPNIPGVDFGPHISRESERVRDRLLAGNVPETVDARAIIAGGVLAFLRAPDREAAIIALARRGILARDTLEDRYDAYDEELSASSPTAAGGRREALILHTILAPPPALVRMGLRRRAGGLLQRPSAR